MTEEERDPLSSKNEDFLEISQLFEQSILLCEQSCQKMLYQRRYNVLSTLIDNPAKVNELLTGVFTGLTQKKTGSPTAGPSSRPFQPFRKGPLPVTELFLNIKNHN